jgi:hypothetical protein
MTAAPAPGPTGYLQPTVDQHDVEGIVRALEDDGFALIPGVLSAGEVKEARRRIDELVHFGFDYVSQEGRGVDHYKCVFNRSPYWLRFLDPPGIIDALEKILGANCHITGQSAWRSFPGAGEATPPLHVDHLLFPVPEELLLEGTVRSPCYLATLHYYLSDIPLELCPTWVLPGSHKSGRGPGQAEAALEPAKRHLGFMAGHEREWRGVREQPVLCRAGDTLLFRSDLWHRGSRNATGDQIRYLLQVHYGARHMAQRFSPYTEFTYNREVLAAASPRQARLLGKHAQGAYD